MTGPRVRAYLLLALFCPGSPLAAHMAREIEGSEASTPLPAATYVDELEQLADLLAHGDVEAGKRRATELLGASVAFEGEVLAPDASVLGPAAAIGSPGDARRQSPRVRALARRLRESDSAEATAAGQPERLARLATRKTVAKGGEVGRFPLKPLTLPEQIVKALTDAAAWVADVLERLWRWLAKLWPTGRRTTRGNLGSTATVVTVVVALAVLGGVILAYRTLKRSRGGVEPVESAALAGSARDEDPLSREAREWERFAQELAAAGRTREAIRAWYHAVLVTLFREGTLHYEKGRTNWEYVSRLAPEISWRPSFIDMTRWFDQEWYGGDRASPDALRQSAQAARGILRARHGAESAT